MKRSLIMLCAALAFACSRQPHALVTIEDPQHLADDAVALSIRLDSEPAKRLDNPARFPASLAVAAERRGPGTVRIEALSPGDEPLARGVAAVDLSSDSRTAVVLTLSKPCVNDSGCDDGRSCNGAERCSETRCVAGAPLIIDDRNPCTDDSCTEEEGVVHVTAPGGTLCPTGICVERACKPARCGDGFATAPEQCDDGQNGNVCDGCTDSCEAIVSYGCGDGHVCNGELCDDGAANTDVPCSGCCRTSCVRQTCDDGVVDPGEACDDGGMPGWDGCRACAPSEKRLNSDAAATATVCYNPATFIADNGDVSFSLWCQICPEGSCVTVLSSTTTPKGEFVKGSGDAPLASAFLPDGSPLYAQWIVISPFEAYVTAQVYNDEMTPVGSPVALLPRSEMIEYTSPRLEVTAQGRLVLLYGKTDYFATYDTTVEVLTFGPAPTFTRLMSSPLVLASAATLLGAADNGFYTITTGAVQKYAITGTAVGASINPSGEVFLRRSAGFSATGTAVLVSAVPGGGLDDVKIRRTAADGTLVGSPVNAANNPAGAQTGSIVDVSSDGSFVVAWSGPCAGGQCPFVRTFDASATPTSGDVRASVQAFTDAVQPLKLRRLPNGEVILVWLNRDGSADKQSVFRTRFSSTLQMLP